MVSLAGKMSYCVDNVMNHCFCEHMALVQLACGSTAINNLVGLLTAFFILVADFIFIASSYIVIFSTVLTSGKTGIKALHTCITHIMVITVSLILALTAYMSYRVRVKNGLPGAIRVFISTMYLLFPSCFNPIIYGIRTTEIRQHIVKTLTSSGRKDLRYLSFTQRGWSSRSLKELPRAVRVSCRGWDVLFNRDDSLAIILLPFPTTSTESRGHPRTELALLTSLSIPPPVPVRDAAGPADYPKKDG
ncbi:hypothetical protein L3Q82_018537 [Scortum barcoo]|uniref:Uncharacterized protein n=1 Tax=Scortum barcoo TaxID=214431 RepID=A0ACB8VGD6_9TELE|nr:hypothetical protein L3Q82_018537 [Scortum barcoo]